LREEIDRKGAAALVVTLLDEVAWLFNLRGTDIDFNPGNSRIQILFPDLVLNAS
jgi:Xaa-Pro aminopeptidase